MTLGVTPSITLRPRVTDLKRVATLVGSST
jgi:hypothetical protein